MTEQPVETMTEQAFLGNRARAAQRVAPAPLTPPTALRPASVIAMSRPYDLAHANILLRKSITAAGKLQQARQASEKAEEAMKAALAAENLAEIDSTEADRVLLEFTREAADQ